MSNHFMLDKLILDVIPRGFIFQADIIFDAVHKKHITDYRITAGKFPFFVLTKLLVKETELSNYIDNACTNKECREIIVSSDMLLIISLIFINSTSDKFFGK